MKNKSLFLRYLSSLVSSYLLLLFCGFHTPTDAQEINVQVQATSPKTVVLHWQLKSAAEMLPISYFEIERSIDGRNFKTIETIQGNKTDYYSFVDKKAFASRLHYRLKLINNLGETAYSEVLPVDTILTLTSHQFVPSKVESSYIKIHLPTSESQATVQIYDAEGVLYFSVEANKSPLIIDINGWQNGEYFVHFHSAQRTEVNRMFVQR